MTTTFWPMTNKDTLRGVLSDADIQALQARNEERLKVARAALGTTWLLARPINYRSLKNDQNRSSS